jgi:hypothetical protein
MEDYLEGKLSSIRNPDGIWINTEVFREAGNDFMKRGRYIDDPWNSPTWFNYWTEQRERIINGYTVGGVKITGDHYLYLNFCPIQKVDDASGHKSKKIKGFPDFWDGDYNYFWVREIARDGLLDSYVDDEDEKKRIIALDDLAQALELKKLFEDLHLEVKIEVDYLRGGFNLIVGKSRRKGYSYKNASVAVRNYYTKPNSLTILNAYEKKFLYPKGIMTMAVGYINFINKYTALIMPSDVVNKTDHIKASYIQYKDGVKIEDGFMSEIIATTAKDNADVNRGKDAEDIIIEESGAFGTPGLLKDLYAASEDCVKAGAIQTGLITIFGTSGDMEGGTADYADMFSRPLAFGLLPFKNIWDKDSEQQKVGFFHPINWNMEGFYDSQGNSDKEAAKNVELKAREKLIENGATSTDIQKRMQEKPLGPGEAFSAVGVNNFPVVELKAQLLKVKANDWQRTKGTPVVLSYIEGKINAKPILGPRPEPITSYLNIPQNIGGTPMIYEMPVPNPPKGLYKIGYDPIRQDQGTSLAAICVYKGVHIGTQYHNILVAEYIGRLESPDDIDRIAEMFADLYSTTIMHENEVTGVKNYFRRIKRLNLLAHQPDEVISKNIKKSKVARVYGCHMSPQLKDGGERYVKDWLLTILDYDENGGVVRVIDRIYSVRLLEELISYNRKGNFDLISSLFMCMFQVQEEELGKTYDKKKENKNAEKLLQMIEEMYKKN